MGCGSSRSSFDNEAHKLFASLGITDPGELSPRYAPLDPIWPAYATVFPGGRERVRGERPAAAAIYVGNDAAARDADVLRHHGITHVVNTTSNLANYHVGAFRYLRWDVVAAPTHPPQRLLSFVRPLFEFLDEALAAGDSVLIHCLAGAHRAGTTGCLALMHKTSCTRREAVRAAKAARPCINPIASPELLARYEAARVPPKRIRDLLRLADAPPKPAHRTPTQDKAQSSTHSAWDRVFTPGE